MTKLRQPKQSNAALAVVIRIWIVTLAILAVPAVGAMIVGLNQCQEPACTRGAQTAGYVGR
jgi:hypothetical protein